MTEGWMPFCCALAEKCRPTLADGFGYGKNVRVVKRFQQVILKPLFQLVTALACGKKFNASTDFRHLRKANRERRRPTSF